MPVEKIRFKSLNPYDALFPYRKVVSREALTLMKELRAAGYQVIVEPDDGSKLFYLTEKGSSEFLTENIAVLVNMPASLFVSLVGSLLYDVLKNLVLQALVVSEDNGATWKDSNGCVVADFQNVYERQVAYARALNTPRPAPDVVPIFEEHRAQVVGWGKLRLSESGIFIQDAKIVDPSTYARLEKGELKGFSVAGLVCDSTCSICKKQYVDCNHVSTRVYDGEKCMVTISKFNLAEVSIVRDPINSGSVITEIQKTVSCEPVSHV